MKKCLFLLLTVTVFISCKKEQKTISPEAIKNEIMMFSGATAEDLPVMDNYADSAKNTKYEGFCVKLTNSNPEHRNLFVTARRADYKKSGYLLFIFENNEREMYVAALKSNDELDIVRWRQTDGINHNLTNKDITDHLKLWNDKNPIEILEVGLDVVYLRFEKPVTDMNVKELADDIYSFCPDVVDQGTGDLTTLAKTIVDMNGIYLWWD